MGKCIHTLHCTVVFRYAISIWKTQLKVQEAFFALHLLLKPPMWELSDYTISFFVPTRALKKNRMLLLESLFNRHDIFHRLCTWCKDREHDKWNPNTVSILLSKCHTLFWPSVRTLWSLITYAEGVKSNLCTVNQFNQMKNISFCTYFVKSSA